MFFHDLSTNKARYEQYLKEATIARQLKQAKNGRLTVRDQAFIRFGDLFIQIGTTLKRQVKVQCTMPSTLPLDRVKVY